MTDHHKTIAIHELAATMAGHHPPLCRSITIDVRASEDPALEQALHTMLTEFVTVWPEGSTFLVNFPRGRYVQGIHYTPSMVIEFQEPTTEAVWQRAYEQDWMNPKFVPKDHPEFASQPIWRDNPVQEMLWPSVGMPEIARRLAQAAHDFMRVRPGSPFTLKMWCRKDDGESELEDFDLAPLPHGIAIPRSLEGLEATTHAIC
ncbi:MAG: hypothetical protein LLG14_04250 [Nocardiaceae bacterium]|nr:hypothetical protein [Nocardiaceae bacterium]